MAQVLIRDLDDETLNRLKKMAVKNHRSLQGELHAIVTQTVETQKVKEDLAKKLQVRSPSAHYGTGAALLREMRDGVRNDLIPGNGKRRSAVAPKDSVWDWLTRRSAGNMSKQEIDEYIRAERESWGLP